jgi:hypothetical protein
MGDSRLGMTKLGVRCLAAVSVAILTMLLLAAIAHAQDVQTPQGAGVIEGRVLNGTSGGPEIGARITVTLHILQGETEAGSLETVTDAGGNFRFEGLDTNPDLEYWPEAVYLDVPYDNKDPYQFKEGEVAINAVLVVYETTDDDSAVRLGSAHFIMESFGQVLRVSEIHLYGNSGDRTFIGNREEAGRRATLFVPLPENAVGLAFEQEPSPERFVEVEGGFLDTAPVPPGQETALIFFSYHLVVTGDTMPLERSFAYPVDTLNILVAQPGLTLQSDQLQTMGQQSFQGQQYDFFAIQGLAADMPLAMQLSPVGDVAADTGMPGSLSGNDLTAASGTVGGNQETLLWFGFALAGLAIVAVSIYALSVRRPAAETAAIPDLTVHAGSRRLLIELADLEEAYESGQIDDASYERERAAKYEALKS